MQQTVTILSCDADGSAEVILVRQSACSGDCHQCSGCGAAKQTIRLKARNPIGAAPGDVVYIHSQSGPVLAGAALLYMLPLALFFLGVFLGSLWGCAGLVGACSFVLGIFLAVLYDRHLAKKKKTVYTITGYAQVP